MIIKIINLLLVILYQFHAYSMTICLHVQPLQQEEAGVRTIKADRLLASLFAFVLSLFK
jgi:hypothetical protein